MRPESKKKSSWLSFFVTLACIIAAVLIVNNFVLITHGYLQDPWNRRLKRVTEFRKQACVFIYRA